MANIEHLLDDIRKDKYCHEMRETFCNALIEANKAAEEMESTVKKIKNEITSVNANAEVIDARCGEENLGDFNRKISSQLDTNIHEIKNNYSTKKELEVERSRINLLSKIENGTTEGNTELLDIRIDSDGIEHESAGDSVRSQFININNKIGEFDYSLIPQDVTTNQTNGAVRGLIDEVLRIETQSYYQNTFIKCSPGDVFEVTLRKSPSINDDGMIHFVNDELKVVSLNIPWDGNSGIITTTVVAPVGTTKMNICSHTNANNFTKDVSCKKKEYITVKETIEELNARVGTIYDLLDVNINTNKRDGAIRGTIGNTLRFESQTYYQNTFIDCKQGEKYKIKTLKSPSTEIEGYVYLCDKLDNIIDIQLSKKSSVSETIEQDVIIPPEASKMYILGYVNTNTFNEYVSCKKYSATTISKKLEDTILKTDTNLATINEDMGSLKNNLLATNIEFISRQGQINNYPENSLNGIKFACENGYNNIRVSVNLTADKVPVLFHDVSINRLARNPDGSNISEIINLRDLTLAEVNHYDWGAISDKPELAGLNITTLEEFVKYAKYKGIKIRLELKEDYSSEDIDILLRILARHCMLKHTTFSGDNINVLNIIYSKCPICNFAVIGHFTTNLVDKALNYKNEQNVVCIDIFSADYDLLTIEALLYTQNKGVRIKVGSAENLADLYKWIESGVDSIEVAYISYPSLRVYNNYINN